MNDVHSVMRLGHYSIHTERSYCDWIKRFIHFHGMKSRNDLQGGEPKIEQFLTHLAVNGNVSPSTQNQAMNALVFLYKKVLKHSLDGSIDAVRARKKQNIPVVLTKDEVVSLIALLKGTPQLVVKLLYGSGLRINEAIRLRVHDIEYDLKEIVVRSGKGDKDRVTTKAAAKKAGIDKRVSIPHLSPQFRYSPFTAGDRHPYDSGASGSCGYFHHHDLHPCPPAGRSWGDKPP